MISSSTERLTQICTTLVDEVNHSHLRTLYTYVGQTPTHEPIYYEETDLFKKMLAESGITCTLREVYDDEFLPEKWDPSSSIIHIPGAMSTELDAHIGSKVQSIRDFVEAGGGFIGWCGGAFWACRETHYREDADTAIHRVRQLALWQGQEVGPLLPYRGNPEGNIGFFHGAVKVKWVGSETFRRLEPNGLELNVLLSGGGSFIPAEKENPYLPLCLYTGYEPKKALSGVKTDVKNGHSVLMNPYFTHGAAYFKEGLAGHKNIFLIIIGINYLKICKNPTPFSNARSALSI